MQGVCPILSAHDSKDVVVEVGRTEVAKAPRYVAVHMREMISDLQIAAGCLPSRLPDFYLDRIME